MTSISLIAGAVALLAGLIKYGTDAYNSKHNPRTVSVTIGSDSIQIPSSYSADQIAALVTALKDKSAGTPATDK